MSKNFFHEINRAPEIHITVEALAASRVIEDRELTPYEKQLVAGGVNADWLRMQRKS